MVKPVMEPLAPLVTDLEIDIILVFKQLEPLPFLLSIQET
jgi:hypothetical protein